MRSRAELWVAIVLAAALGGAPARAQPADAAPTRKEVEKALDRVAEDPNLVPERTVRMLRWADAEEPADADRPWWMQWWRALGDWLRGLFVWVAESARYVVWVLGAILAALLAYYLVRLLTGRGLPRLPKAPPPSHVRDLDIRPESLPDDVGAEAWRLFASGEERAALALLYRGLLSRLVHEHGAPIRASSTEGECLALARPRLAAQAADYAAQLVAAWQGAVYGGLPPVATEVAALCAQFAPALGPPTVERAA